MICTARGPFSTVGYIETETDDTDIQLMDTDSLDTIYSLDTDNTDTTFRNDL